MPTCEVERIDSRGRHPICSNEATWVYVNGEYRRLECDRHAEETRRWIRYPEDIRLEPLSAPSQAAPTSGGEE